MTSELCRGLIRSLICADFYVREAAAQSLEMLGDPTAVPVLMQLLAGGVGDALPVPGRPHLAQPYEAAIEALGSLHSTEAIPLIQPFLQHPVGAGAVRYPTSNVPVDSG